MRDFKEIGRDLRKLKRREKDFGHTTMQTVCYLRKSNMGWYQLFGCPSINY